jgi:DNA-binding transcriptional regulator LsrR (DeoR family)
MVAKLHYEAGMSQVEIARKIGVSTASVSRLLQRARDLGIVKIEVLDLASLEGITTDLINVLRLKRAAVIEAPSVGILEALAAPVDALIRGEGLQSGSVIGIGWGRAVREVLIAGLSRVPGARAVALNGGMQQSASHVQINEFVRLAAEQFGGSAHFLHAPYLSSSELRDAMLSEPSMRETIRLWDRLDCALVGVGVPHFSSDANAPTRDEKGMGSAVGDIIRHYFDVNGILLPWEGEQRMLAVSVDQLRQTKLSIGLAAATEKARSVIGAARSGMINALATDRSTAQAILDILRPGPSDI